MHVFSMLLQNYWPLKRNRVTSFNTNIFMLSINQIKVRQPMNRFRNQLCHFWHSSVAGTFWPPSKGIFCRNTNSRKTKQNKRTTLTPLRNYIIQTLHQNLRQRIRSTLKHSTLYFLLLIIIIIIIIIIIDFVFKPLSKAKMLFCTVFDWCQGIWLQMIYTIR